MKHLYILSICFLTGISWAQTGGNTSIIDISGNSNILEIRQENSGGNIGHSAEVDLIGNYNSLLIKQIGSGNMLIDITVTGNNHSITANQRDEANHRATVTVINSGGPVNLNLLQQGSTANLLNFYQSCANPNGCTVSVNQSGP